MSRAPSAQQTEARFTQWWDQVGSGTTPEGREDLSDFVRRVGREAFHAGASYVATHAGLNESIQQAADGGTGVTDDE
jgi:hypothetical protein